MESSVLVSRSGRIKDITCGQQTLSLRVLFVVTLDLTSPISIPTYCTLGILPYLILLCLTSYFSPQTPSYTSKYPTLLHQPHQPYHSTTSPLPCRPFRSTRRRPNRPNPPLTNQNVSNRSRHSLGQGPRNLPTSTDMPMVDKVSYDCTPDLPLPYWYLTTLTRPRPRPRPFIEEGKKKKKSRRFHERELYLPRAS